MRMTTNSKSTGDLVRDALFHARVSQRTAAQRLGLSQAAISRRLSGDVDFTVSQLAEVAKMLDRPITAFIATEAVAS